MKILMVSTELFPFAKTGGLADSVRALTDALHDAGHDVRVILPGYKGDGQRRPAGAGEISLGYGTVGYKLHRLEFDTGFPLYEINQPSMFRRKRIYGDDPFSEYSDNSARFSLFYRAVEDACNLLDWHPDIVHCHDWHAAPLMALHPSRGRVLSIHNFGYRGWFPSHEIHYTGLEKRAFSGSDRLDNRLSFLACGLRCADEVTAVSPSYAGEITKNKDDEFSAILRSRSSQTKGILNGMDYTLWNPQNDTYLPGHYSASDLKGKEFCKSSLQRELGLAVDSDIPLIGMIGRLAAQKGIEPLLGGRKGGLEQITGKCKAQVAVLGSGESWAEKKLRRLADNMPNISAVIGFSEELAHKIEAGADFFLMPSLYEPCGLNQMYSLAYGTVPIVSRTGGLIDTVEQFDPKTGRGTGFFIDKVSPSGIYHAARRAVTLWYANRATVYDMRRQGMGRRFTWEKAARAYEEVYRLALANS